MPCQCTFYDADWPINRGSSSDLLITSYVFRPSDLSSPASSVPSPSKHSSTADAQHQASSSHPCRRHRLALGLCFSLFQRVISPGSALLLRWATLLCPSAAVGPALASHRHRQSSSPSVWVSLQRWLLSVCRCFPHAQQREAPPSQPSTCVAHHHRRRLVSSVPAPAACSAQLPPGCGWQRVVGQQPPRQASATTAASAAVQPPPHGHRAALSLTSSAVCS